MNSWQRAWRNLILHFINYKLFAPVISVWVPANDSLTIDLRVTKCQKPALSKQPHPKALWSRYTGVWEKNNKIAGEDNCHQVLGVFRKVALGKVSGRTGGSSHEAVWAGIYHSKGPNCIRGCDLWVPQCPNWKDQLKGQYWLLHIIITGSCSYSPQNCVRNCAFKNSVFFFLHLEPSPPSPPTSSTIL